MRGILDDDHSDHAGLLEDMMEIFMSQPLLRTTLYEDSTKHRLGKRQGAARQLLRHAFAGMDQIDWLPFGPLPLAVIVPLLRHETFQATVELAVCINWSGCEELLDEFGSIINSMKDLEHLHIFEDPNRESEGPVGEVYAYFAQVDKYVQTDIFLAGTYSHAVRRQPWLGDLALSRLPNLKSFPFLQLILHELTDPDE